MISDPPITPVANLAVVPAAGSTVTDSPTTPIPDPLAGPSNIPARTPTSDSPTREELLAALDVEIANISSERAAAGWNSWAILGALAGLLWLFIDSWEKKNYELK